MPVRIKKYWKEILNPVTKPPAACYSEKFVMEKPGTIIPAIGENLN